MLISWSTPFCLCFSLRMRLTSNSSNFWAWFKLSALVFFLCCFQHPSHRLRSFRSHNSPCWWVSFIYTCLLVIWWRRWTFLTIMFFCLTSPFWDLNDFLQWMKMVLTSDRFWEFFFLSFLLLLHFWFFRVSGFSIFDFIRLELLPDGNSWMLLLELFSFFWHVCRINLTWIDFFYISDSISLLCCMLLSWDPLTL